ncbi:DUF4136 domain-containing protein [Haloferula sp. A504]|uniref:DUF4136 domain-containing protein n=1 Tax=Haloferula sp. A504 TaxID=3373601 RepID=UPI0031BFD73C|nr:DUF4136 domain-containing protein [Verrucomicrobiaceae bacterium E54]
MKLLPILAAGASIALTSCFSTSLDVEAYPAEGADFSNYKTYAWVPLDRQAAKDFTQKDRALRKAFTDEADRIMTNRGYRLSVRGTPDLFLYARGLRMPGYRSVGGSPTYESRYVPGDEGASWLAATSAGSGVSSGYLKSETQIGVRFLVSEPTTDKEVWRGKGVVRVDDSRSELMQQDDARELARRLLKGFPRAGS